MARKDPTNPSHAALAAALTVEPPAATARALRAAGWNTPAERQPLVLAALGHALEFDTWRLLVRQ